MSDTAAPAPHKNKCILISGLSGCGKSTAGKLLASQMPDTTFIEGDDFYQVHKPLVVLSTSETVANWDHADAIDWNALNHYVHTMLKKGDVVLVTFLPILERFTFAVDCHIGLSTITHSDVTTMTAHDSTSTEIQRCLDARMISKNMNGEDADSIRKRGRDALMVREIVYPTHVRIRDEYPADEVVATYTDDGSRRRIGEIVGDIARKSVKVLKSRKEPDKKTPQNIPGT